jgi:hypothetical protein
MKFVGTRPLADPDVAARKIVELANSFEPILLHREDQRADTVPIKTVPARVHPASWGPSTATGA